LTLTPSLCVIVLKPEKKKERGPFAWFNRGFGRITDRYESGVAWIIRRGAIGVLLFGIMVAAAFGLWRVTPGSLVPDEDQGFYIAAVILPDGATLERTDRVVGEVVKAIRSNPVNEDVVAFTGFDLLGNGFRNNAATIFVTQKHWDEREVTTPQLVGEFYAKTGHIKEGLAFAFAPPAIFGLGTAGGFELYLQNRGEGGPERMAQVMGRFMGAASQEPQLGMVQTPWRPAVPQLRIDVDRERAKALGVPLEDLYGTLAATMGSYYVNDFNKFGRTWQVLMSADPAYRNRPDDIGKIFVRSQSNEMVPLASLARVHYSAGPDALDRFNNLPAVKIFGSGAPGVSTGQALEAVERVAAKVLPPDFSFDWAGASYQEKRSAGTSGIALGLAVVMVFLILAAQYEKWTLPLSVLLALPFGTFGALAAVWVNNSLASLPHIVNAMAPWPWLQFLVSPFAGLARLSNDVYFQIGLVTLLGLAAKNAILIVEYAVLKREEGLSASAAAVEAARLRFRPILMTSLAFILGVLPLAVSTGAGAGARHSVGTGVMGGMMAATFLAIFFVPMFFKLMTDRHLTEKRSTQEIKDEIGHERNVTHRKVPHPHHAPHHPG
ncbi:MAG TPA: efflux RND transporter permease subunit, partial [Burkholderiales bacterium]